VGARKKRRLTILRVCANRLIHFINHFNCASKGLVQIHINSQDGVPIYIQIINQVKHLVASGRLGRGEEIPPIRVLAERLLINPNTVARAYLELERNGIVTKRHGSGTYVSEALSPLSRRERLKVLTQRVDSLLVEAGHFNIDLSEVIELLRERHESIHSSSNK
jgi:GntR family transcriptional regulator